MPTFRGWCSSLHQKPKFLVEPFAGGGIISLTALSENLAQKAVMVELDNEVAAVWKLIVEGHAKWLADKILTFNLTKESLLKELSKPTKSNKEIAFHTILKNRTFHGGILAPGSGILKHGENGKGITSRWYPRTIANRLLNIGDFSKKIDFRREDGLKVMQEFAKRDDVIFFIDPPYTAGGKKAGKRLYNHSMIDHERLFSICEEVKGDFLMTYDNADEVKILARKHGFQMRLIPMNNTHHAAMEELVIGRDLSWMDGFPSVHEPKANYRKLIKTRLKKGQKI